MSSIIAVIAAFALYAQTDKPFEGYIYNKVYNIYIRMDFYEKGITVPGQEVFGELDGFIGSDNSSQVWAVVESKVINDRTAEIEVINNYGSEDFTAVLTLEKDGSYKLRHKEGSVLKFPLNNKWQKIPGTVTFVRK